MNLMSPYPETARETEDAEIFCSGLTKQHLD